MFNWIKELFIYNKPPGKLIKLKPNVNTYLWYDYKHDSIVESSFSPEEAPPTSCVFEHKIYLGVL
jgi:hypothetical protein